MSGLGLGNSLAIAIARYLVVIDRGHIHSIEQIKEQLAGHGIEALESVEHARDLWTLRVSRGPKEAHVTVAILGREKGIEENLAQIIRETHGETVKPTKQAVNKWLRTHRISDAKLVEMTPKRILEEALPGLTTALKHLAQDP
ncbi:MAG: hypothetical protein F7C07_07095 [Desulfurococcales archaeon]|nr:hypothetical protein [Desulfurococcales archaeon]